MDSFFVLIQVDGCSRIYNFDEGEKLIDEYEERNSPSIPMHSQYLLDERFHQVD